MTQTTNKVGDKSKRADPGGKQDFYFYNQTTLSFGKNEFVKIWGDRELKDNWRLSSKAINKAQGQQGVGVDSLASNNELFDPQYYISQIPTNQHVIDSISKDRNFAYYQLGSIYKEKFKEFELAQDKLEKLLENNPEERLVLPSKYNLYKIYVELGLTAKADNMKNEIISNYSDSRYAQILLNPSSEFAKDENSPERIYEALYKKFNDQAYAEVISGAEENIIDFEGDPIVPKFEILKASAKGRLYGFEAYKEGVNYIALTYPNSVEGKRAEIILSEVIPVLEKKEFVDNSVAKHFNVLYPFEANQTEEINAFVEKLNDAVSKVTYFDLTTSVDVYDANTVFVVVHGLKSVEGASGFAEILEENKHKIVRDFYSISSPNYEIIQRHKNLNDYLASQ
jgi:tetratricopeptide (TPR) repeat protein